MRTHARLLSLRKLTLWPVAADPQVRLCDRVALDRMGPWNGAGREIVVDWAISNQPARAGRARLPGEVTRRKFEITKGSESNPDSKQNHGPKARGIQYDNARHRIHES